AQRYSQESLSVSSLKFITANGWGPRGAWAGGCGAGGCSRTVSWESELLRLQAASKNAAKEAMSRWCNMCQPSIYCNHSANMTDVGYLSGNGITTGTRGAEYLYWQLRVHRAPGFNATAVNIAHKCSG